MSDYVTGLRDEVAARLRVSPSEFEFHAKDFLHPRGRFPGIHYEERVEIAIALLRALREHNGHCFAMWTLHRFLQEDRDAYRSLPKPAAPAGLKDIKAPVDELADEIAGHIASAYVQCFAGLLPVVTAYAEKRGAIAEIVLDEVADGVYNPAATLAVYDDFKGAPFGYFRAIVDRPRIGTGKQEVLLQLADLTTYLLGQRLLAEQRGRPMPEGVGASFAELEPQLAYVREAFQDSRSAPRDLLTQELALALALRKRRLRQAAKETFPGFSIRDLARIQFILHLPADAFPPER